MAIGAGPSYTNAVMGQAPSAVEREKARKASSSILRQDCIQIEESDNYSPSGSWSMHFDRTDQAPYSSKDDNNEKDDDMMTQNSLLYPNPAMESYKLAQFLRTTGPTAPHRRPSKLNRPRTAVYRTKDALRFLTLKQRRSRTPTSESYEQFVSRLQKQGPHQQAANLDRLNFQDEGGLLEQAEEQPLSKRVKQKVSSEGTKYLALQVDSNPDILESEVSVSVVGDDYPMAHIGDWMSSRKDKMSQRPPTLATKLSHELLLENDPMEAEDDRRSLSSIQQPQSYPRTPEPRLVALSTDHCDKAAIDDRSQLPSQIRRSRTSTSLPLLAMWQSEGGEDSLDYAREADDVEIKHPSPRRLASHPLLLKRASSITASMCPRTASDSPGPPPKSPLRLRREARHIEDMLASDQERKATPKIAPSIKAVSEYHLDTHFIKPTVVTECSGPIKRPRSRDKDSRTHNMFLISRKARDERIRARKLRDRPVTTRTIDAVVNASSPPARQRLRKARPQIQIPDFKPNPFAKRASSSASSSASWKKVTEHTSVSTNPHNGDGNDGEKIFNAPVSPVSTTLSNGNAAERMTLSSVMLVAEEVPISKAKSPNPPKGMSRESKVYAPRPRSASIPRHAAQRRSRQGTRTPTRPNTPDRAIMQDDDAPPLPSPPPTRALPPTPLSELQDSDTKKDVSPIGTTAKELLGPVLNDIAPNATKFKSGRVPHVVTQTQRRRLLANDYCGSTDVNARLEALEKNNALLEAALTAVLRTNGTMNSPLPAELTHVRIPMVWEDRIARRSAASQGGPSSNGGALEMYMNTRRGSKHGR